LKLFAVFSGSFLVLLVLWEIFETMIVPRTAMRAWRPTATYYRFLGHLKSGMVHRITNVGLRETLLASFGPFSLLVLVVLWSAALIIAFALVHWGIGSHLRGTKILDLDEYLYFSGTCFFTLGLGDLAPTQGAGRVLAVAEAGLGFGLLAAVIGYLPTLYQSFSDREAFVVRVQNRCGGVIDGFALVGHFLRHNDTEGLAMELRAFEEWAAEVVEATESYPMLALYRSQHSTRSWVGLLVAGMDACAALRLPAEPPWPPRLLSQAEASFSMGRRALDTVSTTLRREPKPSDRRSPDFEKLQRCLGESGVTVEQTQENEEALWELGAQYEPQAIGLARFLALELP
jgi:hypothetical protein